MRNKSILWLIFVGVAVCALMGAASLLQPARALPPRPPTPTFTPIPPPSQQLASTVAQIELCAQFPSAWPWNEIHWQELWTVVQWQDNKGQWHDVEGWRGTLDRVVVDGDEEIVGRKTWWVSASDLGEGPFRWLVYRAEGGRLLVSSEEFYLPGADGQTAMVEVALERPW